MRLDRPELALTNVRRDYLSNIIIHQSLRKSTTYYIFQHNTTVEAFV